MLACDYSVSSSESDEELLENTSRARDSVRRYVGVGWTQQGVCDAGLIFVAVLRFRCWGNQRTCTGGGCVAACGCNVTNEFGAPET